MGSALVNSEKVIEYRQLLVPNFLKQFRIVPTMCCLLLTVPGALLASPSIPLVARSASMTIRRTPQAPPFVRARNVRNVLISQPTA